MISSDLTSGFRCLSLEVVATTCFGQAANCFENGDFESPVLDAVESTVSMFMAFKHFSIIRKSVLMIPEWFALRLFPKGAALVRMRNVSLSPVPKQDCFSFGLVTETTDAPIRCSIIKSTKYLRIHMATICPLIQLSIAVCLIQPRTKAAISQAEQAFSKKPSLSSLLAQTQPARR